MESERRIAAEEPGTAAEGPASDDPGERPERREPTGGSHPAVHSTTKTAAAGATCFGVALGVMQQLGLDGWPGLVLALSSAAAAAVWPSSRSRHTARRIAAAAVVFLAPLIAGAVFADPVGDLETASDIDMPSAVRDLQELGDAVAVAARSLGVPTGSSHTTERVRTASQVLVTTVPEAWVDRDLDAPLIDDDNEPIGVVLLATPDLVNFYNNDAPGVFFGVSSAEELPDADTRRHLNDSVKRIVDAGCVTPGISRVDGGDMRGHWMLLYGCDTGNVVAVSAVHGELHVQHFSRFETIADVEAIADSLETLEVDAEAFEANVE